MENLAAPLAAETPTLFSTTTVLSLLSTIAILGTAYFASVRLLPQSAGIKTRILFVWHAFDGLIHLILEASFLYNCFFSYTTIDRVKGLWDPNKTSVASAYLAPNVYFLGHKDRLYGAEYATNPFGALWMEYAKADARWGGSDLNIVSLELLTVGIGGPLALWICHCLRRQRSDAWFWMMVLATGELYGGFMTFAPEWLSGNPNLDASNFMYMWLYLFFFNMLWVWLPLWILWEGYANVTDAMAARTRSKGVKKRS